MIESFEAVINGRPYKLNLTGRSCVVLDCRHAEQLLYLMEQLLIRDTAFYYTEADKDFGYHYDKFEGESKITFSTGGSLKFDGTRVTSNGAIPYLHVIRHLRKGHYRSAVFSNEKLTSNINIDLTSYNPQISKDTWIRLTSLVNDSVGFEFVKIVNSTSLSFCYENDKGFTPEGLRLMYSLISECFLTNKQHQRVVIITGIGGTLTEAQTLKLIEAIGNIARNCLCITDTEISPDLIKKSYEKRRVSLIKN